MQPEDSLIGFRTNLNGRQRWIAFSAGQGYEKIAKAIALLAPGKIVAGQMERDAWVQIGILLVIIAIATITIESLVIGILTR